MINQPDDNNRRTSSAVKAGLIGTAVGAAIGVAAVALTDKKTRDRTLKKAKEFQTKAVQTMNTLQKRVDDYTTKSQNVASDIQKGVKETTEKAKSEIKESSDKAHEEFKT